MLDNSLRSLALKMESVKLQLVLNKGTEKYIFRYEKGSEDKLLDALIAQAKNKSTNFDWFDAAVLSFQLTRSLIGQADELLMENKTTSFA
ncbi:MAG TPA: hypothetical protein PLP05_09725 [Sedimentisphaerales bacterium]|nr:hypothetical protein [Sedimentisphaerales bacterium]